MEICSCVICGSSNGCSFIDNVFDDKNTLSSGRKLSETINEIVDTTLIENNVGTKKLCRNCYKECTEYDLYRSNINNLKSKLCDQYKATVERNTDRQTAVTTTQPQTPKKITKEKFVVPASKLQPLPADYQLNLGKIAAVTVANAKGQIPKPLLNLKVTIGNAVLTQSLTTSTVKIGRPRGGGGNGGSGGGGNGGGGSAAWTVSPLPTEIFSGNEDGDEIGGEIGGENGDENYNEDNVSDVGNNEEMEIDAETTAEADTLPVINAIKSEYTDGVEDAYNMNGNFIRILQEDEQEDQPNTILGHSDNTILQMISGQKLVYENGELSLVMDENVGDDGHDSNDDESQIELQVSGDEETANAIIAAAQEQGGAFIKVESGEMYRVKSVQSKPSDSDEKHPLDAVVQLVAQHGDHFKCLICENSRGPIKKTFDAKADDMMAHMKAEHSAKVYICGLCCIVLRNRTEYSTHNAKHANSTYKRKGATLYTCGTCKKTYNSKTLLQEHANVHTGSRPYACHVCDKTFASKYTRQAHLKTHQKRPRPFKCTTCEKTFLSQQNLVQHERTHLGIKNFICAVCNKAFGTQHNLEVHGVVHTGHRGYVCEVCEKAFARRSELADHVRIHTGERPFECDACGARFSQRSNLHSHKRATHFNDRRHACAHCPKRFKRRRLLEYHIKAAHTGERPLKCEVCHSTFVYPEHYKKHVRIHNGERPYYCEICGKAFNSRDNRNTHRFVHSDKKPYECLACGASYMRKRMLVQHMNANGHLAESIVVNQPRVTKIIDEKYLSENKQNNQPENNADADKMEDEKNADISSATNGDSLNTSQNTVIVATDNSEGGLDQTQMTNENGEILRFIQVQMPDGGDGWVVLND